MNGLSFQVFPATVQLLVAKRVCPSDVVVFSWYGEVGDLFKHPGEYRYVPV
jgi:hypothetical protein